MRKLSRGEKVKEGQGGGSALSRSRSLKRAPCQRRQASGYYLVGKTDVSLGYGKSSDFKLLSLAAWPILFMVSS